MAGERVTNYTLTLGQSLSIGGSGRPAVSLLAEFTNAFAVSSDGMPFLLQLEPTAAQRPDVSMGYRLASARPSEDHYFATNGLGGRSVADLSPGAGGHVFENAISKLTAAFALAPDIEVEAVHWIQGEQDSKIDTPPETYTTQLTALRAAFIAEMSTITGQDLTHLPWIMSQTASWAFADNGGEPRTGLTQLDMARTLPNFYVVGGQYQLPYIDPQHLTAPGYYYLGELHARVHQAVLDGQGWSPFAPVEYEATATHVDVRYQVPTGALEFDTTTLPAQPNMGFSLTGTAATITGVSLVGADTVRLAVSRPITENGARVGYGVSATVGGRGVGNLCDGETYVSQHDGTRLANWALHSLDEIEPSPAPTDSIIITAMYFGGADRRLYAINPS